MGEERQSKRLLEKRPLEIRRRKHKTSENTTFKKLQKIEFCKRQTGKIDDCGEKSYGRMSQWKKKEMKKKMKKTNWQYCYSTV